MDDTSITFVTAVKYSKQIVEEFNHLTFLFDPNWNVKNNVVPTLPVCFYRVETCEEVMDSDVSTKQMLFYNDSTQPSTDSQTSGLMNVVADNIIIKPKQYKMKVLLPANDVFIPIGSVLFNLQQQTAISATAIKNNLFLNTMSDMMSANASPVASWIWTFVKDLALQWDVKSGAPDSIVTGNDFQSWWKSVTETPMFNKNSLEAMWRNRSVLKMKTWDSWRYKYVVITNLSISKEPTADGIFECSMSVQEVPMLNVSKSTAGRIQPNKNNRLELIGNSIKSLINAQEVVNGN